MGFLPINPRLPSVFGAIQSIKYLRTIITFVLYCVTLLASVGKYEIIHVCSAAYSSFILGTIPAILIAKLYGKKIVLNYHSGHAEDHLKHWKAAIPTSRLADEIVVPSYYLADVFARFGLRARVIFNFVDTDRFLFRERHPLRPVFLSGRNLEPRYNIGCVLRAFAVIQKRLPAAHLIVAGYGSQRHVLERLARELDLRNIEFTGRVEHEKMAALYDRADIFLNGSDVDNMPLSILEAFASGMPIVTTDAGGIPYLVIDEETGLLVRRDDYQGMAAGAIRLLRDGKLALKIGSNVRNMCDKYTWPAVRREWTNLYYELASSRIVKEFGWRTSEYPEEGTHFSEN